MKVTETPFRVVRADLNGMDIGLPLRMVESCGRKGTIIVLYCLSEPLRFTDIRNATLTIEVMDYEGKTKTRKIACDYVGFGTRINKEAESWMRFERKC